MYIDKKGEARVVYALELIPGSCVRVDAYEGCQVKQSKAVLIHLSFHSKVVQVLGRPKYTLVFLEALFTLKNFH